MSIKTNSKSTWGLPPGKDASAITLYPYLRLGAAVVVKAVKDLQDQDILRSVDALDWWLSDAPFWLRCLGFEDDLDLIFSAILEDGYGKQRKFIGLTS